MAGRVGFGVRIGGLEVALEGRRAELQLAFPPPDRPARELLVVQVRGGARLRSHPLFQGVLESGGSVEPGQRLQQASAAVEDVMDAVAGAGGVARHRPHRAPVQDVMVPQDLVDLTVLVEDGAEEAAVGVAGVLVQPPQETQGEDRLARRAGRRLRGARSVYQKRPPAPACASAAPPKRNAIKTRRERWRFSCACAVSLSERFPESHDSPLARRAT